MPKLSTRSLPLSEAAEILGAEDLGEAERLARIELWFARRCPVCRLLLRHAPSVTPESHAWELVQRFERWERDDHAMRLAAAWIVLRRRRGM